MSPDATARRQPMTTAQARVYRAILAHIEATGSPPTVQETANAVGTGKITVHEHIEELIRKGYLRRPWGAVSRGLQIVAEADWDGEPLPAPPVKDKPQVMAPLLERAAGLLAMMRRDATSTRFTEAALKLERQIGDALRVRS